MTVDRLSQIVRLRLRSLFSGALVDSELDEELRDHVERQVDANVAAGMTPEAARRSALRAIGGVEQRKEECRDTRRVSWLIDFGRDLRHGARQLARSPMFATAAILSLGIGIGANVSMFSIVDALLLKKLPVPNPDGLVHVTATVEPPYRMNELMFEHYERLRDTTPSFSAMAAVELVERSNVSVDNPVKAAFDSYLASLGAAAPVKNLAEFVARGEVLESMRAGLAADLAITTGPGSPEHQRMFARRETLRQAVMTVMAANKLDAILYPHQKRLVVPIGEDQAERNGVLSNSTGFPALTFQGGFSPATATAPIDAFERASRLRKAPPTTPPLK